MQLIGLKLRRGRILTCLSRKFGIRQYCSQMVLIVKSFLNGISVPLYLRKRLCQLVPLILNSGHI
ncbi:CRE_collapsed_G0025180.mRNA.1.CDS.1 [Saccharomyces cerevisiae]|nr:BDC_1c_G0025760.mRNA.1.CDS.1 [Saccharomyces cerevisiae]CAI4588775.1 CFA_G0034380.mRNA.1.CDS.1 [Saccharomyces cerevisiae]CAI4748894.1 ABH_G0047540.mRNA.1.CDS.1 [Saccharomyces cerevisiae]CAI6768049.1 BBF_HP1_G0048430.mRNA.1.CDS.1 [Saccharomyces cerevisiae]CAI6872053.1 ABH_G0047540.mRNA.1.CDS.1 [Saccharomyces cerevisiae]